MDYCEGRKHSNNQSNLECSDNENKLQTLLRHTQFILFTMQVLWICTTMRREYKEERKEMK